jgi:2-polyprenyl-6-methoxyphenol hydroxylase-like FAD-dependent oxidoreductase
VDGNLPVLICGAGPTGLTLAIELSRFGVPFRIIDRALEPTTHSRALAVQARTLELLEACRITERVLMFAQQIRHVDVRAGERTIVAVDLDGMPTAYSYIAMVGQDTMERTMIVCLHEQGVAVERGLTLNALQQHDDGVEVELAGEGGIERVRCRYLAACDGAHSTIRHLLDVPFSGHALPERFALADVCLETPLPRDRLTVMLGADGGAFVLIPLPDVWRTIVESPTELPAQLGAADVQQLLDANHLPARVQTVEWTSTYHVQQRKVAHYIAGRTFFLGDAAHIHSPIGGQGMNAGIADAVNLAWKLALVVSDGVDPRILRTYHDERETVGRALLAATDYGNRVALNANTAVRALRNAVAPLATRLPLVRDRLRENVAGLRVAYPYSPLSVNDVPTRRGLRAGMRVRGHRPGGYRPQPVVIPEGGQGTMTTIVMRPDGYAGYVADGAHAGGANTYLQNVIGLAYAGRRG